MPSQHSTLFSATKRAEVCVSENENVERLSTIPDESLAKKAKKPVIQNKQIPVRLHPTDHATFRDILRKDKLSVQQFIRHCVHAYIEAEPAILKMLKVRRENAIERLPTFDKEKKHILSFRERAAILDEIEKSEKK